MLAEKGSDNLEILYHARGEEIKRLKAELNELNSIKESEVRSLQHEVALLKGDKMRLESNLVFYSSNFISVDNPLKIYKPKRNITSI